MKKKQKKKEKKENQILNQMTFCGKDHFNGYRELYIAAALHD